MNMSRIIVFILIILIILTIFAIVKARRGHYVNNSRYKRSVPVNDRNVAYASQNPASEVVDYKSNKVETLSDFVDVVAMDESINNRQFDFETPSNESYEEYSKEVKMLLEVINYANNNEEFFKAVFGSTSEQKDYRNSSYSDDGINISVNSDYTRVEVSAFNWPRFELSYSEFYELTGGVSILSVDRLLQRLDRNFG